MPTIGIAICYFAPQISKIYKGRGLDHKDPFSTSKVDSAMYSSLIEVLIVGDFNARNPSEQVSILFYKKYCNTIWITKESNHQWEKILEDEGYNLFGEKLLPLCGAFDLVICNALTRWENFSNFTFNTYNGENVVDYVIFT